MKRCLFVPLVPLVPLLLVAACTEPEPDLEVAEEVAALTAQEDKLATNGFPTQPLDGQRPTQGVARMESAQLSRLSVGRFWSGTYTSTGAHRAIFRSACSSWDTGMYVVRRQACTGTPIQCAIWQPIKDARFNDDCTGTGCVTRKNSKIDMGPVTTAGTHSYDVYLFSNTGGSFGCTLQRSLDGGTTWSSLASNVIVGGQLVDVGSVKRGSGAPDAFEVKTLANEGAAGPATSDTQMLLFDVGTASQLNATGTYQSTMVPVWNDGLAGVDIDPRVGPAITQATPDRPPVACQDPCTPPPPPRHFLVIGTRPVTGALELSLDVVRTPANVAGNASNQTSASFARTLRNGWLCSTGTIPLESGRYQAYVDVTSSSLYGDGNINPACGLAGFDCNAWPFYRGRGNVLAFKMKLQYQVGTTWYDVVGSQRDVPLGSFGSGGLERKIVDFEVAAPAGSTRAYALCTNQLTDPSVTFPASWHARKNPRFSELKVATFNMFKYENSEGENRNISNLLLTRGRFSSSFGSVHEADRAPFEWAADIVAVQEDWASVFVDMADEAQRQSSLDWHYVYGQSKDFIGGYRRDSGLFTHEYLLRDGTLEPARDDSDPAWRCGKHATSDPDADAQVHCYHHDTEDGGEEFYTWSIPGKTRVRRWSAEGTADQPIMVYNVQFEPWGQGANNRVRELDSLITTIKQQLAFSPDHFNNGGANATSPTHAGNRIILIGDFNTYAHQFGEHRWLLKRLRDEFGWAVDVAAADRSSFANFYDMHELQGRGMWGEAPYEPVFYQSASEWKALSSADKDPETWWWNSAAYGTAFGPRRNYPYWARTNRGETGDQDHADAGGERNDVIMLVGRGWQKDDPVRSYVVMNTTAEGDSPFALRDAAGRVLAVDTWFSYSDSDHDVPGSTATAADVAHYRPLRTATTYADGCTARGCAALNSDHIPVGARLRVGE